MIRSPKKPPEIRSPMNEEVSPFHSSSKSLARTPPPTRAQDNISESEFESFSSDIMDDTMITVNENISIRAILQSHENIVDSDPPTNEFQEVISRGARKRKNISPVAIQETNQTSPSKIYLEISGNLPFNVKNIAPTRVAIFKLIKAEFTININRSGTILIALADKTASEKLLKATHLLNIPITCKYWSPPKKETKIVVYNVPLEIPLQEMSTGLTNSLGNPILVSNVCRLGKPNEEGQISSKSVLFTLKEEINMENQLLLFGQKKAFKYYSPKPIQCQKCLKLGHTTKFCSIDARTCIQCNSLHDEQTACLNCEPKCINCKGPHRSDNKSICPSYKLRTAALKIAEDKSIPFIFAAMEAKAIPTPINLPQPSFPEPVENIPVKQSRNPQTPRTPNYPTQQARRIFKSRDADPGASQPSTPQSASTPKRPSYLPLKKTKTRKNPTQTTGIHIDEKDFPPLITPLRKETRTEAATQDSNTQNLMSNMCLFMLNMLALDKLNLPPQLKADIANEIASTYLPKDIVTQAEARFTQILNKHHNNA